MGTTKGQDIKEKQDKINKKKKVVLVTDAYPYGFGEKIFLSDELEELTAHYNVTIISNAGEQKLEEKKYDRRFENQIRFLFCDWTKHQNSCRRFFGVVKDFFSLTFLSEVMKILKAKKQIGRRTFESLFFYRKSQRFYRWMKKNAVFFDDEDFIYYTFWNTCYTLALLKNKRKHKNVKVISRFHGCDLYAERTRGNWQPFKEYMDERIDKCFFACQAGQDYYIQTFVKQENFDAAKYMVCKLGKKPYYAKNPEKSGSEKAFCLVSCAMIIPLKRVELIVKALSCMKQEKVEWIHFGSGGEADEKYVKQLAEELLLEKENITYKFMGYCEIEEIMRFYVEKHIDCFITTSSTEGGVPLSIQEALSMGIPVIGTDAGGISESIKNNGILLSVNPEPQEVADAILQMYYADEGSMKVLRENSYHLFQKEYNAEVNVKKFIEALEVL